MPKRQSSELDYMIKIIDIEKIDPSPFQRRKYFNEHKLKELAASIQREGLIEPIVVRPYSGRYQLIAGERRWRAIRDYTNIKTIQGQTIIANDLQARRISAAENIQREDFSAIESIEAIVEIVDAELIEDGEYAAMGKLPMDRVKVLLDKLDFIRRSEQRGYEISDHAKMTSHKFVGRVEQIFKNLPKPLEWRSFYTHDLPLVMDFCEEVREISIHHRLNKSQTRALAKLKKASKQEFQKIAIWDQAVPKSESEQIEQDFDKLNIRDLSAREIEDIADKAIKKELLSAKNRPRRSSALALEVKIILMDRLGILVARIAARLKIDQKTVLKYSGNPRLVKSIRNLLEKGLSAPEVADKHACPTHPVAPADGTGVGPEDRTGGYPEPLIWSIALERKSDQERFESLNWGLRTWDYWYFSDIDQRFGDDWPGRIPAQLVAHTLFYFTRDGDLVFDPMAGGGVVPDTCLAFHRKCWSFDLVDRLETRPEIEPFQWNPERLQWPVKGKEKPDLIFFDPPYFNKLADQYTKESISSLDRTEYLRFLQEFLSLAKEHSKSSTRIAFLNADWRDFQGVSALEEDPGQSIRIDDYIDLLKRSGWEITHIIDCPLSTQRFQANIVSQMQKNRILGVVRRSLIVGRRK